MNKEEKYYHPVAEEFHIGFEYEYKGPLDTDWHKDIFGPRNNPNFESFVKDNNFRVKFLDKEDIEQQFKFQELTFIKPECDEIEFTFVKSGIVHIGYYTPSDKIMSFYEEGFDYCIFKGTIKNKSELKKTVDQLGI